MAFFVSRNEYSDRLLDVNEDDEDLVVCDGSGDGGIDIAYLRRAEVDAGDENAQDSQAVDGDVW